MSWIEYSFFYYIARAFIAYFCIDLYRAPKTVVQPTEIDQPDKWFRLGRGEWRENWAETDVCHEYNHPKSPPKCVLFIQRDNYSLAPELLPQIDVANCRICSAAVFMSGDMTVWRLKDDRQSPS